MDFLDPNYDRGARIKLLLGYCLVSLAIGIATLVLLYWSYGYNIDQQGQVAQNGLLFVASQPSGASIYLNGQRYASNTNTRVTTEAGSYMLKIAETGYRSWERPIVVAGGDVQDFTYPFLFPRTLKTTAVSQFKTDPSLATQSLDQRWLLLAYASDSGTFAEYDMSNPAKPVEATISVPASDFTSGTGAQQWKPIAWASDNRHVLLLHDYTSGSGVQHEYILFDRQTPSKSVNLTTALKLSQADTISLYNGDPSQFYVYNATHQTLQHINGTTDVSELEHVLAYKTYGSDVILYATNYSPTGKTTLKQVSIVLQMGQKTFTLRTLPSTGNANYMLDLAQYSGDWYVAIASTTSPTIYIYKNPQQETTIGSDGYPAPWRRVALNNPSYMSFSANDQFLLMESGQNFLVYDFENDSHRQYQTTQPLDKPQTHATWMDGYRLEYVSRGKLFVFDYDYYNQQTLVAANPAFLPFYSNNFSYLYTLEQVGTTHNSEPLLASTPLVVK